MKCKNCQKETQNPVFCSSSCSASFNNRNRKPKHFCENCGGKREKISKLCSKCSREKKKLEIYTLIELGEYKYHNKLKQYLSEKNGYKCAICGNEGIHMRKKLTLQLDHVDGNSDNNKIENLRLLCPNCHTQTVTYAGGSKNKKKNDVRNKRYRKWYNSI